MGKICGSSKTKMTLSAMKDGVGSGQEAIDMRDPLVVDFLHQLADIGTGESRSYQGVWFEFKEEFTHQ
jgi:hypothetical protein